MTLNISRLLISVVAFLSLSIAAVSAQEQPLTPDDLFPVLDKTASFREPTIPEPGTYAYSGDYEVSRGPNEVTSLVQFTLKKKYEVFVFVGGHDCVYWDLRSIAKGSVKSGCGKSGNPTTDGGWTRVVLDPDRYSMLIYASLGRGNGPVHIALRDVPGSAAPKPDQEPGPQPDRPTEPGPQGRDQTGLSPAKLQIELAPTALEVAAGATAEFNVRIANTGLRTVTGLKLGVVPGGEVPLEKTSLAAGESFDRVVTLPSVRQGVYGYEVRVTCNEGAVARRTILVSGVGSG
ncbi:MAG: hypothetical protein RDV41_06970 [Planctomycetota bacterium]|nr:hypothetical protein [Planctomycetota bacterium]